MEYMTEKELLERFKVYINCHSLEHALAKVSDICNDLGGHFEGRNDDSSNEYRRLAKKLMYLSNNCCV